MGMTETLHKLMFSTVTVFKIVGFQVLIMACMKMMTAFWGVGTSGTSVRFSVFTWCYVPEDSKLQTSSV
jgi:hypothetical protein